MYIACVRFRKQLEIELEKSYTGQEVLQEIADKEDALWAKCIEVNDTWNAEVALDRDERMAKEREVQREVILGQLIDAEEQKKRNLETIEEIVRMEKVRLRNLYRQLDGIQIKSFGSPSLYRTKFPTNFFYNYK